MASNGSYSKVQAPVRNVHTNLDQNVIQVTEDKLLLVLNEHLDNVERKNEWIAPLGILIAIITTFSTSNFKEAGFSAPTWEAIFFICGLLSAGWLVRAIYIAYCSPSIEQVVEKIKNSSGN